MTNPIAYDELALAEAVATGELSLQDAASRLGPTRDSDAEGPAVRNLRVTIAAIQAVQAHARATRAAGVADPALGGWLPGRSSERQGTGAGDVRRSVDRRGTVTPVLPGPVRPRPRRVHDGRTLAVAASLVLAAGALGLAFAGSRTITPSPRPSANGLTTSATTATTATTAQSVPPVAGAFRAADRPDVFEAGGQFGLTSATTGWLRTYDAGSRPGGLFRTTDAGQTWTQLDVPPQGATRFVDDTTAYTWTADRLLLVTHDGGATWRAATISTPPGVVGPWFVTAAGSDVMFATFSASDTGSDLLVYATHDGGSTWSGPTHGTVAVLDPSFNKPQGGDNGLLWMTLGKADDKPFDDRVAVSADGGATWSIQHLPADSTFPASNLKGPSAVRPDGRGGEILALSDGDATGIYTSAAPGQPWKAIRTWTVGAIVELRSATAWTATTPTAFWSTTDAGQTWRQTPRDAQLPLVAVTFATPDVGWAEVVCSHPTWQAQRTPAPVCGGRSTGAVLLATADGGATWVPIDQ